MDNVYDYYICGIGKDLQCTWEHTRRKNVSINLLLVLYTKSIYPSIKFEGTRMSHTTQNKCILLAL